jgi:glycoside/pentoside/hexuronide:cation symporter, GPH family
MASATLAAALPPRLVTGRGLAAYALLGLPLAMTALPINILLPDYYAANTGLALTVIGLVLLATRLVDAVADPLLGSWVDSQKGRGGYLRPVLIAAPLLALGFVLLFNPPQVNGTAAASWLFATLVAAYLGYSLATVAYQAWGAELAHDDAGRTRITGAREGAGLVGVLVGGALPSITGMGVLTGVFLVALALALVTLWRGAPRAPRSQKAAATGNPFSNFVLPLQSSRLRWLLAVFALNAIAPSITATVFQFFVADRLGLASYTGMFLALYFIAGAASMPLWIRLARKYSLHSVWLTGMVASVAAFIWAFAVGPGDLAAFAFICVLSGFAFGADLALPPALLARVIDANGHDGQREGAYFGLWNFVNKLTLALAGGIALPLLEAMGYARGSSDAAALTALAFVYAVVPCLLKLVAAALLYAAWRQQRF